MDADPALTPEHEHDRRAVSRDCRVVESRRFGAFSLLSLAAAEIAERAEPGQFVMVGVPGAGLPPAPAHLAALGRRRARRLLVEARGEGSAVLAAAEVGDTLAVAGPLGSGFPLEGVRAGLLVAAASARRRCSSSPTSSSPPRRRSSAPSAFATPPRRASCGAFEIDPLWVATDDGSVGRRGTVVDLLDTIDVPDGATVFACGPAAMVTALGAWAAARGLRGYASLEAHMACGTGACHGCVVATRAGYRRVCADGPVFALDDLGASSGRDPGTTEEAP